MKTKTTDKRSPKAGSKSHKTTATGKKNTATPKKTKEVPGSEHHIDPRMNDDSSLQENSNSESNQNGRKGNM